MADQPTPLMPHATATWLVDNTALSFEQIAQFCGLHILEVQAMADDLKVALIKHLEDVERLSDDELLEKRYERLRNQGVYRTTP